MAEHSKNCPGAPGFKGICCPPCPAYEKATEAAVADVARELQSNGCVCVTVKDGKLFLFSRAVIEELHAHLQANPTAAEVHFMVFKDKATLKAATTRRKNVC